MIPGFVSGRKTRKKVWALLAPRLPLLALMLLSLALMLRLVYRLFYRLLIND